METFSALLAIYAGNSPVPVEFAAQKPVTRSFDLRLNKRVSKQPRGWWFETLSRSSWRHRNDLFAMEFMGICYVSDAWFNVVALDIYRMQKCVALSSQSVKLTNERCERW